ncbi:hypothetical protein P8452_42309 [Trifolium repens]|nr:hypothetical protein QL285_026753 [Trifolium repens]WJX56672.1 hypothetical protein P8452_42309 [Trifolium repens]
MVRKFGLVLSKRRSGLNLKPQGSTLFDTTQLVFNDSTALTEDDLYELRNCWTTCFLDPFNPKNDYDDGAEEGS